LPAPEDPISRSLEALRGELMSVEDGEVASYFPELAKADRRHLAIAIATPDGRVFAVGDAEVLFTIQSVSQPFAYGHAFACYGRAAVLEKVGVEPTGDPFNSIVLDDVTYAGRLVVFHRARTRNRRGGLPFRKSNRPS
jgi:glutaminase